MKLVFQYHFWHKCEYKRLTKCEIAVHVSSSSPTTFKPVPLVDYYDTHRKKGGDAILTRHYTGKEKRSILRDMTITGYLHANMHLFMPYI
jgi:hypothetical protein